MEKKYVITISGPLSISERVVMRYIENAVNSWRGGGDPGSPLTEIKVLEIRPYIGDLI